MRTHVNSQGKKWREKSSVLILFLKVGREGAKVTLGGRLLQARTAATGNARSPTVESRAWNEQRCRRSGSKSPKGVSICDVVKIS